MGSYICRKLLAEKVPFIAMVRPSSNLDLLSDIRSEITLHEGDVLDPDSLIPIISDIDTIIHCAAVVSFRQSDRSRMDEVNVTGTRNMVDLALSQQIKYFVHISSVAALGRNSFAGTVDENNKWQYSKWNTSYAESKYRAELEVWRGVMEGLSAVVVNPSVILGPGDWEKSSASLFKYVWDEKPFFTDGVLNYIDVRDVADIVFKLLHKKVSGERYILNTDTVQIRDFFEKIAGRLGRKAPRIKATPAMIRLALILQAVKSLFSDTKPLITRETARVGKSKIYFDNTKIKRELNHTFVPLAQTIDWTCEFFLKEKVLTKN